MYREEVIPIIIDTNIRSTLHGVCIPIAILKPFPHTTMHVIVSALAK